VGSAYNVSFPIQTANSNTLSVALSAAPLLALCGTPSPKKKCSQIV
jgi:hypothetical protein